jgi:hypothetical protein
LSNILFEIVDSTVKVVAVNMEGLEYLSRLEDESLESFSVDVGKSLHPGGF